MAVRPALRQAASFTPWFGALGELSGLRSNTLYNEGGESCLVKAN